MTASRRAATSSWLRGGIVLLGLLALAAILRLAFLDTRGTWDADQGHDMSVLRLFVRDGVVPLLGPPTSIGDVHHGALYYYLLAPAAALTGGDSPLAVTAVIALSGIAAVGVTWWLARDIGGSVAGLVAGLVMAVSATAVDESTFIWNPNLIALSSAVALAGAWRAWTTGRTRWWLLAAAGTAVTMQCHVLGVTLLPIVGALFVADVRSRPTGPGRRAVLGAGLAGLAILALSYAPLVAHELTSGFSEVEAALAYLRGGGEAASLGPATRALVVGLRVVSWPLTGLITDGAVAGVAAAATVIAIAVALAIRGTARERQAARWLGFGLIWTIGFLTFASPSLATVVPGLPNDHYHAFADPMVFVLAGLGAGALWRTGTPAPAAAADGRTAAPADGRTAAPADGRTAAPPAPPVTPGRVAVVLGLVLLLTLNLSQQPPVVAADGGFPAADRAALRIAAAAGGAPVVLRSLPDFKSAEAYAYPLLRAGVTVRSVVVGAGTSEVRPGEALVVVCDAMFAEAIGSPCGGPAEAAIAPADTAGEPVLRFEAAPGRFISVYAPAS